MKNLNLLTTILITGIIAGTLDILAAIFILAGGNAVGTFKYIARGAFGEAALQGGNEMVAWGAFFHYLIAMSWTAAYFLLYPKLSLKWNKWLNAAAYGAIVWTVMNLVVVPLSQITNRRGFELTGVLKNMLILMVCIGLPVSLMADKFYSKMSRKIAEK